MQLEDKLQLVDKLMTNRRYKELVQMYKKAKDDTYREFKVFNYRSELIRVGEKVRLQENHKNEDVFVAVVKRIICIRDPEGTMIPLVKVQWYGQKEDVIIPSGYSSCISNKELFLSTQESYVPIDLLQKRVRVLTYPEYENLQWEEEWVFFSRSGYSHLTYEVTPPIHKWPKACICQLPQNPDHEYISCDRCQLWFHQRCVGFRGQQEFICPKCK